VRCSRQRNADLNDGREPGEVDVGEKILSVAYAGSPCRLGHGVWKGLILEGAGAAVQVGNQA
jgi:hypothetical protein